MAGAMAAKPIRPSRNNATACSLAALNTAGAAPPARPAAIPSASAGKSIRADALEGQR